MSSKPEELKVCWNPGKLPLFVHFVVINRKSFLNSSSLNISFDAFSHLCEKDASAESTAGFNTLNVFCWIHIWNMWNVKLMEVVSSEHVLVRLLTVEGKQPRAGF